MSSDDPISTPGALDPPAFAAVAYGLGTSALACPTTTLRNAGASAPASPMYAPLGR